MVLRRLLRRLALFAVLVFAPTLCLSAPASDNAALQSLLHLLDYLAVDYPPVVANGGISDEGEYAEQREFAAQAKALMAQLPDRADKPHLEASVKQLADFIDHRAPGADVQTFCRKLSSEVIAAYQVEVAPAMAPSLQTGAALYAANCAQCHGSLGFGDGPLATTLDPKPINFHDGHRQNERSLYSLYSTISLGVKGTAMRAFSELDSAQRWALSFYVSNFLADDEERARGATLWREPRHRNTFAGLAAVTRAFPANYNDDDRAILAYLRSRPDQIAAGMPKPLDTARNKLDSSAAAYRAGNRKQAYDDAVSAYLDGFELIETPLVAVNPALKDTIERAMENYRQAVKDGSAAPGDVARQSRAIIAQLEEADAALSGNGLSPIMAFTSSLIILLREGLEAILVLAAIITFLIKTERRDAVPQVHLGWVAALAAGVLTWYAAKELISFTSISRELMEGYTALFSAVMLLYVGYWLHNHSHAERWKSFIRGRIHDSVGAGTVWGLVFISFVAVYREAAETILFYETLWLQTAAGDHRYLLAGLLAAAVILLGMAWAMFRLSVRLPLKLFFRANAALLTLLAVVFAGKGIAALQEAGQLRVDPINFPEIHLLGIYPTLESLGAQLTLVTAAVAWLLYARSREQH